MPAVDVVAPGRGARLIRPLARALRANAKPALALQCSIAGVMMAYAWLPAAHHALSVVARWNATYGFAFSAPSTVLFAALVPTLVDRLRGRAIDRASLAFLVAFWAWKGVEVAALYRLQVRLFGSGTGVGTIAAKVFIDQFVYGPLWASPTLTIAYALIDARLDPATARARLGPTWYRDRVLTVQVSSWIVWVPTVAAVYCLPSALQLPVANLVMCLWALILGCLTRDATPSPTGHAEPTLAAAA